MKKRLLFCLFLFLFFPLSFLRADNTLSVNNSSQNVEYNETLTIDVSVDHVDDLFGINFRVNYDHNLLNFDSFVVASSSLIDLPDCNAVLLLGEVSDGVYEITVGRLGLDCLGISDADFIGSLSFISNTTNGTSSVYLSDVNFSIHDVPPYDIAGFSQGTTTVVVEGVPPVEPAISIVDVSHSGIGETTATINWETNVPATSTLIEYGTNQSYGASVVVMGDSSTSSSQLLSSLSSDTSYYYRLIVTDDSANTATSSQYSFATAKPESSSSGGGGGGGGGSYRPAVVVDTSPPAKVSDLTVSDQVSHYSLAWTNPSDTDLAQIIILRKEEFIDASLSYSDLATTSFETKVALRESYDDYIISRNKKYYYAIFAFDNNGNVSSSSLISIGENIQGETDPAEEPTDFKIVNIQISCAADWTSLSSQEVEEASLCEANILMEESERIDLDEVTLALYQKISQLGLESFSEKEKISIAKFIHTGTNSSKILGSGERAGVLSSYASVFSKLPQTLSEWQDVLKIANGRWPTARNLDKEKEVKEQKFREIYKRDPDMNHPNDNAAVTVMTYGLRPGNRNMESEKAAILIYKGIFKQNPSLAWEWDMVRAIAYSGATR